MQIFYEQQYTQWIYGMHWYNNIKFQTQKFCKQICSIPVITMYTLCMYLGKVVHTLLAWNNKVQVVTSAIGTKIDVYLAEYIIYY